MARLDVVKYGDPILRKVCRPVTVFEGLEALLVDMFDTMYEEDGIGLAANQVGLDMNLFVIDVTHTDEADEEMVFINGEILDSRGECSYEEGCLSIPGVRLDVIRPEFIKFRYQDLDGEIREEEFGGLTARAIQHEIDHLTGKFIVDQVSDLQKLQYNKTLKEIEAQAKHRKQVQQAAPGV